MSVTIPMSLSSESTTGMWLILFFTSFFATSIIGVFFVYFTTFEIITSLTGTDGSATSEVE